MKELERVKRAIAMQSPDRVPILFFNRDFERSDMVMIDVVNHFGGDDRKTSEYGFHWERLDETMGHPKDVMIEDWEGFDSYSFPDPHHPARFQKADETIERYGEKYYIASLALSGFTVMTLLHGFENTLIDLAIDPEHSNQLADGVFSFEEDIIRQAKLHGFHAVGFFDDWGTQDSLIISPKQWREFFKPRYQKQFELCHANGLDVYFHCCGYIMDIIDDLIEIGVNILNISQPNLFDIRELGERFGGKVCFLCPISYQTTSLTGTREDIFRDAKLLIDHLGCYHGGLIGYVEEYHSIGLSEENYQNCIDAFLEQGVYSNEQSVSSNRSVT
jgi:uroporphyrinogen decarboxylase